MKEHSDALLLVHPECRKPLRLMAHKVGSTAALLNFAKESDARKFIVATEHGILHKMRECVPDKEFIPAPADCEGCHECGYMKLNTLERLRDTLATLSPEVKVDADLAKQAIRPIEAMLTLSRELGL